MPQHVGMQGERHKGRNVRVPQPGECGAGHISAIGGWDDIPAQVWCFKQDESELVRDRNDPVCGLCFEIIYRILLVVQKGHSAPDGQRAALNVRPLQSKCFFLTKPAVQTEGAEYAGAWFYNYIHQNINLIGKQCFFLFRFSVRGDLTKFPRAENLQKSGRRTLLSAFPAGTDYGCQHPGGASRFAPEWKKSVPDF